MKSISRTIAGAGLALALALPLAAQVPTDTISRQQADEIINELRQIRQLLEKQQAGANEGAKDQPVHAKLNLLDAPMLGNKDAPLTIVEFTDFQCPFCQRFHTAVFPELKKKYIDTGKVRFFSRDYPLSDMHADAMRAAEAGRCATDQGQYWAMRDVMAANPGKLDLASLLKTAGDLKLDAAAFRACVESEKHKDDVQTDIMEALKAGTNATPTFFVGKSTASGVDGEKVEGAQPIEFFELKLNELLAAK